MKGKALSKFFFLLTGIVFVGLGILGAVLPVLPTTPFLIVALWCFSRSSEKLHNWLYTHSIYGPLLRQWHEHRVIPAMAKFIAVTAMVTSTMYVALFSSAPWYAIVAMGLFIAYSAWYILSKPSVVKVQRKEMDDLNGM